jgi:hypothetical protein
MLIRESFTFCRENHMEHTNRLFGQNAKFKHLKWVIEMLTTGIERVKFYV